MAGGCAWQERYASYWNAFLLEKITWGSVPGFCSSHNRSWVVFHPSQWILYVVPQRFSYTFRMPQNYSFWSHKVMLAWYQAWGRKSQVWSFVFLLQKHNLLELHSSRMHTARLLTVSPGRCCAGGGCLLARGVSLPGRGVSLPGVSQHALRQPPPVNRITHTCKNITLPQLRCGR